MTDERAYRGGNHPPTCVCVDCEVARLRRSLGERVTAPFRALIAKLTPRRKR